MRIAVNTRLLLPGRLEGIGRYAHEVLQRLARNHPEHQFIYIFDRPWDEQFIYSDNIIPLSAPPQARHPLLYYIWFNYTIPYLLKKYRADCFFSPDGYLSLRTDIPQIPVIHDLAWAHFPEGISKAELWYYQTYFPKYIQKAKSIITVSQASADDMVKTFHADSHKIIVSCNAASTGFQPLTDAEIRAVREKYTDGHPYFLFVGAQHPRKNLVNLLLAFDMLKKQHDIPHRLLIVGREGWKNEQTREVYEQMFAHGDVVFTGRVREADLYKITGAAFVSCYTSLFEGFGIPILEAMQCGVPVITSNISSMPEVAGGAALLADPYAPTSIAEAMKTYIYQSEVYTSKSQSGLERAKAYSWDHAAEVVGRVLW